MRLGGDRVTSFPRKRTAPEVARNSPERRLRKVDLPAPLGPMTACTPSGWKAIDTPSTAASAPKRRESCFVSSSASAMARRQESRDSPREKEDDRDHHRSHDRDPVIGDALSIVLQKGEQEGAQDRPVEGALAAEEHGHEHQPRFAPAKERGIDEAVERRIEISRQPRQRAGENERGELNF